MCSYCSDHYYKDETQIPGLCGLHKHRKAQAIAYAEYNNITPKLAAGI